LRILKYAAYNSENDVHEALEMLHELAVLPTLHHVEEFLPQREVTIPEMNAFEVSLKSYDQLIAGVLHEG
jgi:hypothetical protein